MGQRRELDRQIQACCSSASASQSFGLPKYAQHASQSVQTHVLPPHPAAQSSYANQLSNGFAHGNLGVPTPVVHPLNQHPVISGFAFGSPFPSPLCGLPPGYCTPISMAPQPQPMIPPSANQPDAHSQCAVAYSGHTTPSRTAVLTTPLPELRGGGDGRSSSAIAWRHAGDDHDFHEDSWRAGKLRKFCTKKAGARKSSENRYWRAERAEKFENSVLK